MGDVSVRKLPSWLIPGGRRPADDAVLVLGDVSPQSREQYERLWRQVRRGQRVLLVTVAVTTVALAISAARGTATERYWLIPPAALALAGLLTLVDHRLTRRPPGSVEVPADLGQLVTEMHQMRDEISMYGPDRLAPEQYEAVVAYVDTCVGDCVAAARDVLLVERSGDASGSASLRAEVDTHVEAVVDVYESLNLDDRSPGSDEPADLGPDHTKTSR